MIWAIPSNGTAILPPGGADAESTPQTACLRFTRASSAAALSLRSL